MKKAFPTFIHESCKEYDHIFVSAGKAGYQIELSFLGHGYSSDLLSECIKDSKEKGKKGLYIEMQSKLAENETNEE